MDADDCLQYPRKVTCLKSRAEMSLSIGSKKCGGSQENDVFGGSEDGNLCTQGEFLMGVVMIDVAVHGRSFK